VYKYKGGVRWDGGGITAAPSLSILHTLSLYPPSPLLSSPLCYDVINIINTISVINIINTNNVIYVIDAIVQF
jgi:hypothetical protein